MLPICWTLEKEGINSLASFYGQANSNAETVVSPVVNGQALVHQYEGYKVYVMKYRNEWETKQNTAIILGEQKLKGLKTQKDTLTPLLSKRKIIRIDNEIKLLEKDIEHLNKTKKFTLEIMLETWMGSEYSIRHPDMTHVLCLAALIPPSTAEVERSFSLRKLISTRLRNRLSPENLSHCMRICKFHRELSDEDFNLIMMRWLDADETKSKSRKVSSRLHTK